MLLHSISENNVFFIIAFTNKNYLLANFLQSMKEMCRGIHLRDNKSLIPCTPQVRYLSYLPPSACIGCCCYRRSLVSSPHIKQVLHLLQTPDNPSHSSSGYRRVGNGATGQSSAGMSSLWIGLECVAVRQPIINENIHNFMCRLITESVWWYMHIETKMLMQAVHMLMLWKTIVLICVNTQAL